MAARAVAGTSWICPSSPAHIAGACTPPEGRPGGAHLRSQFPGSSADASAPGKQGHVTPGGVTRHRQGRGNDLDPLPPQTCARRNPGNRPVLPMGSPEFQTPPPRASRVPQVPALRKAWDTGARMTRVARPQGGPTGRGPMLTARAALAGGADRLARAGRGSDVNGFEHFISSFSCSHSVPTLFPPLFPPC